jgi:predicted acetyltransferase
MRIDLVDARQSTVDAEWLRHVYPFYLHDLSAFDDGIYHLNDFGLWEPDHLPSWFEDDPDQPLVAHADGRRVGFAFVSVSPSPFVAPGADYRMAEFFVLGAERRRGLGRAIARAVLARLPGTWDIAQLPRNAPAIAFWRGVAAEASGDAYDDALRDGLQQQRFRTR